MKPNTLIAYYSHSGNTEKVAKLIQRETGGDLYELEPVNAYPTDYNTVVKQAKQEIAKEFRPELKGRPVDLSAYDVIFVGTPNWWSTMAPPVATFLAGNDLGGKTVAPFCTHGGGGLSGIARDIAKLCAGAKITESLALYGDGGTSAPGQVTDWIDRIRMKQ